MIPIRPFRAFDAARLVFWYLVLAGAWTLGVRRAELGSSLEMALLGGVVPILFGGLWIGAGIGARIPLLAAHRVTAPSPPWGMLRDELLTRLKEGAVAAIAVGLLAILWSLFGGASSRGVLGTHLVYAGVGLGGVGLGVLLGAGFRDARTSVAVGAILCAPFLTAFAWLPSVTPHTRGWLDLALNASPLTGVLVALDRRTIFWNKLLYGRFPYAEYAVTLWGPAAHAALWGGVGAFLLLAQWIWWRRRWDR